MSDAARRADLEQLLRVLPRSQPFEDWLARTGELPPDFAAMPSSAFPPDLLTFADGRRVERAGDWPARRAELLGLAHRWLIGTMPPRPDNLIAEVTGEKAEAGGVTREVLLRFGPDRAASLRLSLLLPPGDGPHPVFMTQENHRDWARIAVRRGYIGCVYAGADSFDDAVAFGAVWPEHDWSKLLRRAWAGSRCLDYLETLPQADTTKVCITGHSRNGKQSLMAAATDPRFACVISSSSGAGGCNSTREFGEAQFGEGVENITRAFPDWFVERLRFFSGREDRLPVDFDALVALAAPRPCLISTAINDGVEATFAVEQTYHAASRVYRLLGAGDNLRVLYRPGGHETWTTVIERYLDFCDEHFGRGRYAFAERILHPHDWQAWRRAAEIGVDAADAVVYDALLAGIDTPEAWAARRRELREQVIEMLGAEPPISYDPDPGTYGREADTIAAALGRGSAGDGLAKQQVVFGEYLNGDIYFPTGFDTDGAKHPAILWCPPMCCSHGYGAAYRRGELAYRSLARAGYVVFCLDPIGTGRRVEEVEGFYARHPDWSLLGKMVRDNQAALDALERIPFVDAERTIAVGYHVGAFVALHLAAIDERLDGLVTVCGPAPFRLDRPDPSGGGWQRWARRLMLLPRLALYDSPDRLPYDIPLLHAAAAPARQLVVTPLLDREAPLPVASRNVETAQAVYRLLGASEALGQQAPESYSHFDQNQQAIVVEWLKAAECGGG